MSDLENNANPASPDTERAAVYQALLAEFRAGRRHEPYAQQLAARLGESLDAERAKKAAADAAHYGRPGIVHWEALQRTWRPGYPPPEREHRHSLTEGGA